MPSGIVEGAAEATAALLKVISGWLTDRWGRREPLVVAGYGVSSAARPLIGLATIWPVVAVLHVVDRVGKGLRTSPRDALIADAAPPDTRGRLRAAGTRAGPARAVLGPLVAAALLAIPAVGLRHVFLLAALPGLAAWRSSSSACTEPPRPPTPRPPPPSHPLAVPEPRPAPPPARRGRLRPGQQRRCLPSPPLQRRGIGAVVIALLWAGLHAVKIDRHLVRGPGLRADWDAGR